jgi:hypothetical protein
MERISAADLRARHGDLLAEDVHLWCGTGWRGIVDDALDALTGMNVVVTTIREKLGSLQLIVWPRGAWRDEDLEASHAVVAAAWERGKVTCEICSQPGRIDESAGTWSCRCEAHREVF